MKIKLRVSTMIYFVLSSSAFATDYLMYIGAGGEPKDQKETMFDKAIKNVGNYVNSTPGLNVNVALNGGHEKTEALVKQSFPNATTKTNFLTEDYERLIQTYKTKLENKEMGPGDQFMIYIETHGADKTSDTKSHKIATSAGSVSDFNTLAGSTVVSVDQLEILKNLAKERGVKMAIIDTSCHSGNTLALADENTCVISSTGPKHYGYNVFSQNFSAAMAKGKNLEEIFLETRRIDATPALPMISTQSGQDVSSILYDKITPFLYTFSKGSDKLTPYLEANQSDELQCQGIENYNSLRSTIQSIEELNTVTTKILWWKRKKHNLKLDNLKNLLEKYEANLERLRKEMQALNLARLNKKEVFRNASHTVGYTWKELLETDFKTLTADLQVRLTNETSPENITLLKDLIAIYNLANEKKEGLIKTQPDLAEIPAREEKMRNSITANYFTAAAIGIEERKIYSALYREAEKNQLKSEPNPCKNFKL